MAGDLAGIGVALADEQVGLARDRQQRVGPFGVAGIGEDFLAVREPQRGRRRARAMDHLGGDERMAEHVGALPRRDLHHLPGKPPLRPARLREEHFQRGIEPRARAGRPRDQQRPFAAREKLRVEQQERQAAEMIAVQMRQHDAVDPVRIEPARLQRRQSRGAAIDQQRALGRFQPEAGVEAAARAEGVAGAGNRQSHEFPVPCMIFCENLFLLFGIMR